MVDDSSADGLGKVWPKHKFYQFSHRVDVYFTMFKLLAVFIIKVFINVVIYEKKVFMKFTYIKIQGSTCDFVNPTDKSMFLGLSSKIVWHPRNCLKVTFVDIFIENIDYTFIFHQHIHFLDWNSMKKQASLKAKSR